MDAIAQFDRELRNTEGWIGWKEIPSQLYASVVGDRRYSTRKNAKDARDPIPIKMKSNAVGLLMFGDIHVDSLQCNWPELDRCVAICESTEGMRGVSLGDPYR